MDKYFLQNANREIPNLLAIRVSEEFPEQYGKIFGDIFDGFKNCLYIKKVISSIEDTQIEFVQTVSDYWINSLLTLKRDFQPDEVENLLLDSAMENIYTIFKPNKERNAEPKSIFEPDTPYKTINKKIDFDAYLKSDFTIK